MEAAGRLVKGRPEEEAGAQGEGASESGRGRLPALLPSGLNLEAAAVEPELDGGEGGM